MNEQQLLRDPNIEPTSEIIAEGIGMACKVYVKFVEKLLKLPINQKTKEIIENAKPMGKTMRFIPVVIDVRDVEQLSDVYTLSEFRKIKVK